LSLDAISSNSTLAPTSAGRGSANQNSCSQTAAALRPQSGTIRVDCAAPPGAAEPTTAPEAVATPSQAEGQDIRT
jgi:hypothetical protein